MKKITLLTALLAGFVGFSQSNRQTIQAYLNANKAKYELTAADVADWVIESEVPGSGTGITSTYIVQRYLGTEIFNAQNNVWVKNGAIINMGNNFKSNIASKINVTTPSLTVFQALSNAYTKLGVTKSPTFTITETINSKTFKISDGLQEDIISAKLVYQTMKDNKLRLAWGFQFFMPTGNGAWDIRIDALNGSILEKNDLMISCSFDVADHDLKEKTKIFSFEKSVLKTDTKSIVAVPGVAGQYRVIPYNYESPNHSPFQLIQTNGNLLASPNGWHDSNSATGSLAALRFNYTRGNNVWAREDSSGDNEVTVGADVVGGSNLIFDFPYVNGVSQTKQPTEYTSASTTNLFYMMNILHDVSYNSGFNEVSGNFQKNNLNRGGSSTATGDFVQADAQDGYNQATPTLNNANFSALADGIRPRCQMYMWTSGAPPTNFITINSPPSIAGQRVAFQNSFFSTDKVAIPPAPSPVEADFVLYNNNPTPPGYHSACQVPTNPFDLSGKIVLIRRGSCLFKDKVKNAQNAGAIGVIVMDSIPLQLNTAITSPPYYNGRVAMNSTALNGITIPAVFVNKTIGDELESQLALGPINGKIETPNDLYLYADGDFDNGIMAHEYTHGISGRLTGGPANPNCLNAPEQQGEGWSDWMTLMMQLKTGDVGTTAKGIGTYAENQPTTGDGIRNFPYSVDMNINPLTFGALNGKTFPTTPPLVFSSINTSVTPNVVEPHNTGEVWCAMLWDLTWAYIDKYGFNEDIYNGTGGNNKVMRLVFDGMKLQQCNPSYVQARDAIIAADQATTGGADYCMIWSVFARRGLGINASSGDNSGTNTNLAAIQDEVEDFTEPIPGASCTLAVNYFENNDMFRVSPNPSNGLYNIRINNFVGKINLEVVDINGRLIINDKNIDFNNEKNIDLSGVQSGVYILKISGENINYSQKLIKK